MLTTVLRQLLKCFGFLYVLRFYIIRFLYPICIYERGGMPLHDAVGINCKKGAITEHQDSAVKYMG